MFRVICLLTICFSLLKHGSAQQNGSFKDVRDGKVYKTVKIGSQEWMAENLNTDRFRNGDFIPQAKTWEELVLAEKTKQPAWFAPEIDGIFNTSDKSIGKFYNWYAVTDQRGLAPQGWYIPTRLDWEPLRIMEGRSIKVSVGSYTNREDWLDLPLENIGNHAVRNETGFSAIPTYITRILPVAAYWWSMSNFNSDEAYIFSMGNSNVDEIYEGTFPKYFSLSVRCFRKVGNEKINTGLKQNTTTNNNNSVNNSPLFNCSDLIQKVKHKMDNTKLSITGDGAKDADNFIEKIIKPAASEYTASLISNANRIVSKEEKEAIANQTINCI
ncbi:MAG: fibrobacter succinogenes major paralogous domain-containing protein, partial [Sphingobacteriales bacterium]